MADSPALRARRSRRHSSGDHSICRPDAYCRTSTEDDPQRLVATLPVSVSNVTLGERGQELWQALRPTLAGPLQVALLLEVCRIADRLDTLDRQLHGDAWLRFRHHESGVEVTVYVDRVLSEAREQATTFKGLVAELLKAAPQKLPETTGGGVLADLTARIAERRANPTG